MHTCLVMGLIKTEWRVSQTAPSENVTRKNAFLLSNVYFQSLMQSFKIVHSPNRIDVSITSWNSDTQQWLVGQGTRAMINTYIS